MKNCFQFEFQNVIQKPSKEYMKCYCFKHFSITKRIEIIEQKILLKVIRELCSELAMDWGKGCIKIYIQTVYRMGNDCSLHSKWEMRSKKLLF